VEEKENLENEAVEVTEEVTTEETAQKEVEAIKEAEPEIVVGSDIVQTEKEAEEITEQEVADADAAEVKKAAGKINKEVDNKEGEVQQLRGSRGPRGRGEGRKRKIETVEPEQSEWKEQVVQIRRVTKVVKGGKKLSFRAIVVVGNKKGQVGLGVAKAAEVIVAIQKAVADGRKNLVNVPIFKTTIPHQIQGRSGAGSVVLRPASEGTGVIAGGVVRAVLELAGIENILSKSLGSKSPLNAANATLDALKSLRTFKEAADARGISIAKMLG